jgi:hypothetical protein
MKRCPECSNTYPDSERFCSSDGAALVPADSAAHATVQMPAPNPAEPPMECPVCGGKALPGEEVCSFCGTRLGLVEAAAPPPPTPSAQTAYTPSFELPRQTGRPTPSQRPTIQHTFDDEPPPAPERSAFRRFFAWTGYLIAAIVALAAGAWFALHLSTGVGPKPAPSAASPAASPAPAPVSGPIAALATNTPVQVTGESASDPSRNTDAATKLFTDNSSAVLDTYKKALAGDTSMSDGVLAALTVTPGGDVVAGSIKTSTAPNPALDSELVKTMMGWHFAPFSGSSVEVSYPVVMAPDSASRAAVESALADKVAHLSASETPEYASAPPPLAAPPPAGPAPEASPALAAREPITPPVMPPLAPPAPSAPEPYRPRHRHREAPAYAPPRPPTVTLLERVQERLRADRRFGRVKAYTNGGGVVTLYGRVFDGKAKRAALAAARSVDGVSDVIDSLQTDTASWARQESAISAQLQGAGLSQVTVRVIGKDAYLDGQVSTEAEKEHAVTIAEGAAPVRVRTNLIRVVPKGLFSF